MAMLAGATKGSEAAGILAGMDGSRPRYRDREESRFYQVRSLYMAEHSQGNSDRAQVVRGGRLVDATPEVLREVAESAMLLSQGARGAIEMKREAREAAAFTAADQAA